VSFAFEAEFFRGLMEQVGVQPRNILVAGCGAGVEVAHLADATQAFIIGIDLEVDPAWKRPGVQLLRADAECMPFRSGAFDSVYCYHVLEHVAHPPLAIAEARRVLGQQGAGYFGTPNKSRVVGYMGGRGTTWDKIWWNIVDWGRRLQGQWSNEQGAHAGFTGHEFSRLLAASFSQVESVDLPYYRGKYPKLAGFWDAAFRTGLARFIAPAVYFRTRGSSERATERA
jgi:SAM-dependent methyltransferase